MKEIVTVGLVVGVFGCLLQAGSIKVYEVKSGKITYEIKGSGKVMGSKMQTKGKKRLLFSDYGTKRVEELVKIDEQNIMGKKHVTKTHTMSYMKDGVMYKVDFKRKRIMRMEHLGAGLMGGGNNLAKAGREMMVKMGGKKLGEDKVLGNSCEVWDLMGVKQCIYKGITLRTVTNMMGIKNTEVATKADFNIDLSNEDFKLPDFPIFDMRGHKLDKSKLNEMDKESAVNAAKGRAQIQELKENMAKAAKDAGVKNGQRPTKAQEKSMQKSMMNAMFPRIKSKMLAQSKALDFGKECLESANTLKEAKICTSKMDKMAGSDDEYGLEKWDSQTKKSILGFIEQGRKSMGCVKAANNMQELKACMPNSN